MKIINYNYMHLIKIIFLFFIVFKGLSSFKKLEILDITSNDLDKNAIKHLGAITSLKTLVLSQVGLSGSFPLQGKLYDYTLVFLFF